MKEKKNQSLECQHTDCYFEDWPDGGQVEVCKSCGKSRHHWEQGESEWKMIPNIAEAKKELQKAIDKL